ncbi:hypothetical protein [Streptomyces sp. NPDC018031]|uniref:hypothetical protein n=1 Tax=Streptomyces sp. NPDC018031 TaxID=3365033 RepID=UPI00379C4AE0
MSRPRGNRVGPWPHGRPAPRSRAPAARVRGAVCAVLLGIGCALVPVSVVVCWAGRLAQDTDRYVETVAPIARDRTVQDAVVRRVAQALAARAGNREVAADLARWLRDQGLPPRTADAVRSLAPRFGAAFDESVLRVVRHVVHSEQFAKTWTEANRTAHRTLLRVLAGEGTGAVEVTGGAVTLDIGRLLELLRRELAQAGLPQAADVPAIDRRIVLVRPDRLGRIEAGARLLAVGADWLPVLTVALGTLGLWRARGRHAVAAAALGVVLCCLLCCAGLLAARGQALGRVPENVLSPSAVAAALDTSLRALWDTFGTVIVVGAATAAGAGLTGPGRVPRAARAAVDRAADAVAERAAGRGLSAGRYGMWAAAHRGGLAQAAVLLTAVALGLWDRPTPQAAGWLLAALSAVLWSLALLAASGLATGPGAAVRPAASAGPPGCGAGAATPGAAPRPAAAFDTPPGRATVEVSTEDSGGTAIRRPG